MIQGDLVDKNISWCEHRVTVKKKKSKGLMIGFILILRLSFSNAKLFARLNVVLPIAKEKLYRGKHDAFV